jgi:hypothetical protein
MNFSDAVSTCHIRSAIFRKSKPKMRYWKNNIYSLNERVPKEDQEADDWEEYDPRSDDGSSLFMFNE